MRRGLAVPSGIGLLLLAFGVSFSTPGDETIHAPFAETGDVGEQIASAHLVATVNDLVLAEVVELGSWRGTTAGIWLVVDATIAARAERSGVEADVFVDGVRYRATARVTSASLTGRVADAGFPVSGSILVELPADVRELPGARSAVLRLGPALDTRLDSVIELTIDLTGLDVVEVAERTTPRAGAA